MGRVHLLIMVSVIFTSTAVDGAVNSTEYTVRLAYKEDTSKTNKSANLTCSLSRSPFWRADDVVRWWKTQPFDNVTVEISRGAQRMIPVQDKVRYNFMSPVQERSDSIAESLIIQSITAEDQGIYQCGVYRESFNASNIASNQIFVQPDISAKVNLSSTAAVADGASVYKRNSQGQITSCAAYVFSDPNTITIQVWEDDQDVTKYFNTTIENQILGTVQGFRAAAAVVSVTSATYLPTSAEKEVLRCEARRNNTVIANSSMVVKLSDTEVILHIIQEPAISDLGEALQLKCVPEYYAISNKTEVQWTLVHSGSSGTPMPMQLTSGEKNDIAEASFTENFIQLKIRNYSGSLTNFTVTLRNNGSTIATRSFDLALKTEKVVTRSTAVAWKTHESMVTFTAVMGFFIKQLI